MRQPYGHQIRKSKSETNPKPEVRIGQGCARSRLRISVFDSPPAKENI
jgi:hypothetical protein